MINIVIENNEYPDIDEVKKIDEKTDYCQTCNIIYNLEDFEYICKIHRICNFCYDKLIKIHQFDTDLFIGISPECPICKEDLDTLESLQNHSKSKCRFKKKEIYTCSISICIISIIIIIILI